jgi:hypothetical protein
VALTDSSCETPFTGELRSQAPIDETSAHRTNERIFEETLPNLEETLPNLA